MFSADTTKAVNNNCISKCPDNSRAVCLGIGQVGAIRNLGGDAGAPAHGLFTPTP